MTQSRLSRRSYRRIGDPTLWERGIRAHHRSPGPPEGRRHPCTRATRRCTDDNGVAHHAVTTRTDSIDHRLFR
ncbi:hypothetical protein [Nocardia sp. CC201C]|uniref:hypothetical protein n=1 Tax=Nocardia sp. CC201C TaxID=3044575 RepID=UPI0024A84987|nr:hypothetical protein [Nocardia sp. CC201C]